MISCLSTYGTGSRDSAREGRGSRCPFQPLSRFHVDGGGRILVRTTGRGALSPLRGVRAKGKGGRARRVSHPRAGCAQRGGGNGRGKQAVRSRGRRDRVEEGRTGPPAPVTRAQRWGGAGRGAHRASCASYARAKERARAAGQGKLGVRAEGTRWRALCRLHAKGAVGGASSCALLCERGGEEGGGARSSSYVPKCKGKESGRARGRGNEQRWRGLGA